MLDLLYIGLVVLPLTIAAVAMLLLAVRSVRGHRSEPKDVRAVGRAVLDALGPDPGPGAAPAPAPTAAPAPQRPSLVDLSDMVQSLAVPPQAAPVFPPPVPVPGVGAPPAATKQCPDCAEEVLAAARVCKHCRYRFDEPEWRPQADIA